MTSPTRYQTQSPDRAAVDALPGATVLEFGTDWCGYCKAAQPAIQQAMQQQSVQQVVRHLKVEDGPGRPLGRSFKVKLWPTLIFLRDGVEVDRAVRPGSADEIAGKLARIAG